MYFTFPSEAEGLFDISKEEGPMERRARVGIQISNKSSDLAGGYSSSEPISSGVSASSVANS